MASSSRGAQQDSFIDDEDDTCPLCIEDLDPTDKGFRPCPCGYQVCQFCYNNIKNNMNGLCPACRRPYDEASAVFIPPTAEQIAQSKANALKRAKRKAVEQQKEVQKREVESLNRKHLAGLRVVQKNLVYVMGLSPGIPEHDLLRTLRGDKYFGQYGNIVKIVVSKAKPGDSSNSLGVYVTFSTKEEAASCITAVNGSQNGDRTLRAQLGTTKYCSAYLRHEVCTNKQCMFLHEPGENEDSYSRQDLSSINSAGLQRPLAVTTPSAIRAAQAQAPIQQAQPVAAAAQPMMRDQSKEGSDGGDSSALPSSASWAARGLQNRSRTASVATSGMAPSPAISHSVPDPQSLIRGIEATGSELQPQDPPTLVAEPVIPTRKHDPLLLRLLKSIHAIPDIAVQPKPEFVHYPLLFDPYGGLRRKIAKEQDEMVILAETDRVAEQMSHTEAEQFANVLANRDIEEEAPESGSLQLGGEPEDLSSGRTSAHPPGFPDPRRGVLPSALSRMSNDGSFDRFGNEQPERSLTPQQRQQQNILGLFKNSQAPTGNNDQFSNSNGIDQVSLHTQQNHGRQTSRFAFGTDNAPVASASSSKVGSGTFAPFGSQFGGSTYSASAQGPPPGLKSTGTPPIGFGPTAFNNAYYRDTNDVYRQMVNSHSQNRAGLTSEPGKLDLTDPISFSRMQSSQQKAGNVVGNPRPGQQLGQSQGGYNQQSFGGNFTRGWGAQ